MLTKIHSCCFVLFLFSAFIAVPVNAWCDPPLVHWNGGGLVCFPSGTDPDCCRSSGAYVQCPNGFNHPYCPNEVSGNSGGGPGGPIDPPTARQIELARWAEKQLVAWDETDREKSVKGVIKESSWLEEHGIARSTKAELCLDGFGCFDTTAEQTSGILAALEIQTNLCVICPQQQDPPPNPDVQPGFCTGLRDEYAFLSSEALGGVAQAYNYCLDHAGTDVRQCGRPCAPDEIPPGTGSPSACTFFGHYTIKHYWSPTAGECVIQCSRCN